MRPPERCAGGHQLGGKERMSKKYLYYFSEGNKAFGGDKTTMKNILGGKGAGLAEMTAAKLIMDGKLGFAQSKYNG